ncbi:MAG: hypothetical protein AVDCRST_MAG22-2537 [uncultured Rubrobacteraceae bacterium]|uniref:Uncharacterized protein n=1 Tax=uncultured Rubrobacteraceae bacterium TaxID=349277 RepID=A0A6J4PVG9_9ACTN|nr:MAG: hypothetical protein AVDCRST_MAG22-2537 [uncultured Rubrobacteraceae bacterium]
MLAVLAAGGPLRLELAPPLPGPLARGRLGHASPLIDVAPQWAQITSYALSRTTRKGG